MRRCIRMHSSNYTFKKLRETLLTIEEIRQNIRESMISSKLDAIDRKNRVTKEFFHMMSYVISLPFNEGKFQIKGYEILGDIMIQFKNYKLAMVYYMKGVFNILYFRNPMQSEKGNIS